MTTFMLREIEEGLIFNLLIIMAGNVLFVTTPQSNCLDEGPLA